MRYICDMKPLLRITLVALMLLAIATPAEAQSRKQRVRGASAARWEVDSRGDSVLHITLLPVNIFHRTRDLKTKRRLWLHRRKNRHWVPQNIFHTYS